MVEDRPGQNDPTTPTELEKTETATDLGKTPASQSGTVADATQLSPGLKLGHFVIERQLGAGGMGVVYAARDVSLDRIVALKLLRADTSPTGTPSPSRRARLLREARALAKLDHANVITVYEVGVVAVEGLGAQVFVAMELVDGGTLADWLAQPRAWPDVLDVMCAAGRGLAAAHRAGLVHRDFKPDNILIGADGRVRVTDFGLAAAVGGAASDGSALDDSTDPEPALTRTGTVMGTPLYMSPEQHRAAEVDGRSDQFAFCVTLYQALHDQRPFGGDSYPELAKAVIDGALLDPPRSSRVPSWLHRIVRRGLSADPDARYPDMNALLGAVERGRRRSRRWILGAAAVAAAGLVVAGSIALTPDSEAKLCAAPERHLRGVWDQQRAQGVRAALSKVNAPRIDAEWPRIRARMDAFAAAWATAHGEACRAGRVHKEQSEAVLDLRMACLDRQRGQLRAVADELESANKGVLLRAPKMVPSPAELTHCADIAALRAVTPPPANVSREKVDALRRRLDEAIVGHRAGRYQQVATEMKELVAEIRALGYGPLLAEALMQQGATAGALNRGREAVKLLREAGNTALAARHDRIAARAWSLAVYYAGAIKAYDEADTIAGLARSAIKRLGGDLAAEGSLENNLGVMEWFRYQSAKAKPHLERAVELRTKLYGANSHQVASTLDNLASVLHDIKQVDEATRTYERALAIRESALGPHHPDVARTLTNLAAQYKGEGRVKEAIGLLERALAIKVDALGPKNAGLGTTLRNLGNAYQRAGRWRDAARAHLRTAELFASTKKPRWIAIAQSHNFAGWSLAMAGDLAGGLEQIEKAVAMLDERAPKTTRGKPRALRDLADVRLELTDIAGARAAAKRAISLDAKLKPDHPGRAAALGTLARVEAKAGKRAEALRLAERAVRLRGAKWPTSLSRARDQDQLARLLWSKPSERRRSLELARQAMTIYEQQKSYAAKYTPALRAWLKARDVAR